MANKQFKRYEEKWKCFCAFACENQSKSLVCSQGKEGLCMNQTDYINNLRIHQGSLLTSLLLTTGWTDAKQSHVQYTDYTTEHLNFTFVCVFVWNIYCSQMKSMETQGHDIFLWPLSWTAKKEAQHARLQHENSLELFYKALLCGLGSKHFLSTAC